MGFRTIDFMTDVMVGAFFAIFGFLLFIMFLVVLASAPTGEDKCLEDETQEEFCKTYNQKKESKEREKSCKKSS